MAPGRPGKRNESTHFQKKLRFNAINNPQVMSQRLIKQKQQQTTYLIYSHLHLIISLQKIGNPPPPKKKKTGKGESILFNIKIKKND